MGAAGLAGDGVAHGREEGGRLLAMGLAGRGEGGVDAGVVPGGGLEVREHLGDGRLGIALEAGEGLGAPREVVGQEVAHEGRQVLELAQLLLHDGEDGAEVGARGAQAGRLEAGRGEPGELGRGEGAEGGLVDGRHLALVEAGVGLVDVPELELRDDVGDGQDLAPVLRRPAQQAEVIAHRLGQVAAVAVLLDEGAAVALGHLAGAVGLEDEGDVGVGRQRRAEGAEELDVLRGVGEVVLAADDVGDAHRDVVDHVDEVEDRLAVGAEEDEVAVLRALDAAAHEVVDHHRGRGHLLDVALGEVVELHPPLALEAEPPRAVLLVRPALLGQRLELGAVEVAALRLEIGAAGTADLGTLVPVHPEPAHALEEHAQGLVGVALLVRVLDAEDEGAAGVAGVQPVEEGRPRAADVEEPGGAGGEAGSDGHGDAPNRRRRRRARQGGTLPAQPSITRAPSGTASKSSATSSSDSSTQPWLLGWPSRSRWLVPWR